MSRGQPRDVFTRLITYCRVVVDSILASATLWCLLGRGDSDTPWRRRYPGVLRVLFVLTRHFWVCRVTVSRGSTATQCFAVTGALAVWGHRRHRVLGTSCLWCLMATISKAKSKKTIAKYFNESSYILQSADLLRHDDATFQKNAKGFPGMKSTQKCHRIFYWIQTRRFSTTKTFCNFSKSRTMLQKTRNL